MSAVPVIKGNTMTGDTITTDEIYDMLPMRERTLLKNYDKYPFRIANDRGRASEWYIYGMGGNPVAVVIYYRDRKLCMHGIISR